MNQPLPGCVIAGSLRNPAANFAATAFSLLYQSGTLGIDIESLDRDSTQAMLSFTFKTPYTVPVTCEVTGWSDAGQPAAVSESIIQAACGIMSVHGRSSGKTQSLGLDYVSTVTAALALQGGIAAALGQLRGLNILNSRVSMASAALLSGAQYIADATAAESVENLPPDCMNYSTAPPFISADGVVFELETLSVDPWLKFWTRLGISATLAGKGWTAFLLRYAKAVAPIPDELVSAVAKATYYDISVLCSHTGMSICPMHAINERVEDERFKYEWLKGPWAFDFRNAGQDTQLKPPSNSLPLSGLTVIESCRRIQGPLAGHLLALLGAEVIRIEPPGGDPLRGMPPMSAGCSVRFDALNRLKTVREIDIKSSPGRAEIMDLIRHADVFLHNWAPDKAAQLSLDYCDLADLNPTLVYAYAAGWTTDGSTHALLNSMPGTDFMVQAYSGVAQKIAAACGTQGGSLFTILDVLGGVIAAQGITTALLNRFMHHTGAKVTSSLLSAATLLCSADFQNQYRFFDVNVPARSLLDRVYDTRQGKIAIECCDNHILQRLIRALDMTEVIEPSNFQQQLRDLLLFRTAEEWVAILQQADVPAAVAIENLAELYHSPRLKPHLNPGPYIQVTTPWSFQ